MKKTIFLLSLVVLLMLTACSNKDISGQAVGDMSQDAIDKVCAEQPELCSCLAEHQNYDLCICLKDAGNDYLMMDNCWYDFVGTERPQ